LTIFNSGGLDESLNPILPNETNNDFHTHNCI